MGELNITTSKTGRKKYLHKPKKGSTKVDLTPMVDLGFLLITFFMVSTAWAKPHELTLNLPADGNPPLSGENSTLTLLALKDNKIFYYEGILDKSHDTGALGVTDYSFQNGIGAIIRQKQLLMDKNHKGGRKELVIMIKPTEDCNYENLVNLLDEMLINNVSRHALMDINEQEKKLIKERFK